MTLEELHELVGKVIKERPDLSENIVTDIVGNKTLGIKLFYSDITTKEITIIDTYEDELLDSEVLWIP